MSDEPLIKVTENGPYLVSGDVNVRPVEPIFSEAGEPLTWKSAQPLETKARFALCRCGESANKPFCDGAHTKVDFDGAEAAPTNNYDDRSTKYPGTGVDVYDDRPTCVHAGFCGNQVTTVWKMADKTEDTQVRVQIMAMIEKCPSGALTYAVDDQVIEQVLPSEISPIKDGPLRVTGDIAVERSDGEPFEVRNRVTLCRCGLSASKPLCDGAHKEAGFTS